MAFLRTKKVGDSKYFYWVEGYRDEDGKVKQRLLAYLGKDRQAICRAYLEHLPESVIEKIKDAFPPRTTYIILKLNPDGTRENYYRDWADDFMEKH